MKNLAVVLFCICLSVTIAVLYPCQATCQELLQICNCDTGVVNMEVPSAGAETTVTMSDLIDDCVSGAKNLGNFQSCVAKLANDWKKDGLITGREKGSIQICSTWFVPVETVDFVDIEQYLGLWYQIASYIDPRIGDLAGVTAEYSLNPDDTVKVLNKGIIGGLEGIPVMIEGVARVVDEETNSKLAVSFPDFGITEEGEYWIIELAEDYSYAVVTDSRRRTLFILNRTPSMEESLYQDIVDGLVMQCFDPDRIVRTIQPEG